LSSRNVSEGLPARLRIEFLQNPPDHHAALGWKKTVGKNLLGKGEADKAAVRDKLKEFEEKNGRKPKDEEKQAIINSVSKEKTKAIYGEAMGNAANQAKDYAVGI
jgi:hypothetical protein